MRILIFIFMLIVMMLIPISFFQLPDEWVLNTKVHLRHLNHNFQKNFVWQNETGHSNKSSLNFNINKDQQIYTIALGDSKEKIERLLGQPKDEAYNEYQNVWKIYHHQFQELIFIMYEKGRVVGIYTNQPNFSVHNVTIGSPKNAIHKHYTEPLQSLNGMTYQLKLNDKFSTIHKEKDAYITLFYDQYQSNKVAGIKIIAEQVEQYKPMLYQSPNDNLKTGFRKMSYYLINGTRTYFHMSSMKYDEEMEPVAQLHAQDMAENQYFNHLNKKQQSPFDRMAAKKINYQYAGENLAMGQVSAIEAHHGLMNSKGHRKNILNQYFNKVGIGIDFGTENQPYFVENYRN
ncbi:CAP-associated domain-containing protein [Macrococcus sp. DPC7161]|uniref:CAP domain-containing protein n=1 Tax=Macrococcus sp. DPC7161 TaxID=2507060 RepID=UPI00100B8902|nr:CAP-associated domain-containing protein [Macrococcus sp. DPC7161]RXK19124.1 CAP domain-containing protein [Macrococcus sp. DPC7161]